MGKTRPCEFFQFYEPLNAILPPILSAQGDLNGEIPKNRFLVVSEKSTKNVAQKR